MNPQYDTRTVRNSSHSLVGSVDGPTNQPSSIGEAMKFIGAQQHAISEAISRARNHFGPVLRQLPPGNSPTVAAATGPVAPREPSSEVLEELCAIIHRNRDIEWAINRLIDAGSELQP